MLVLTHVRTERLESMVLGHKVDNAVWLTVTRGEWDGADALSHAVQVWFVLLCYVCGIWLVCVKLRSKVLFLVACAQ